jgi:hypothetical protein
MVLKRSFSELVQKAPGAMFSYSQFLVICMQLTRLHHISLKLVLMATHFCQGFPSSHFVSSCFTVMSCIQF